MNCFLQLILIQAKKIKCFACYYSLTKPWGLRVVFWGVSGILVLLFAERYICSAASANGLCETQKDLTKMGNAKEGKSIAFSRVEQIPLPKSYQRVQVLSQSFAAYLRQLPLRTADSRVYLYDGRLKPNQSAQYAVVDLDIGKRDLQQCADAIIRLQAEYLYQQQRYQEIAFHFTSGDLARYQDWTKGMRPKVDGSRVHWQQSAQPSEGYADFRRYLDIVFAYAGTRSLAKELSPITDVETIQIGDVFIQPGSPGHAVLVVDMAIHTQTGAKIFLLLQSYMPAQDIHILKNPQSTSLSPWYGLPAVGGSLYTPEWKFNTSDLRRWPVQ